MSTKHHKFWPQFVEYFIKRFHREPSLALLQDVTEWRTFKAGAEAGAKSDAPTKTTFVTNPLAEGAD